MPDNPTTGADVLAILRAILAEGHRLSEHARIVLVRLVLHRNGATGKCFPARTLLAAECGCSIDTIDRALVELRSEGLIQVQRGRGRNNSYILRLQHLTAQPAAHSPGSPDACQATQRQHLTAQPAAHSPGSDAERPPSSRSQPPDQPLTAALVAAHSPPNYKGKIKETPKGSGTAALNGSAPPPAADGGCDYQLGWRYLDTLLGSERTGEMARAEAEAVEQGVPRDQRAEWAVRFLGRERTREAP